MWLRKIVLRNYLFVFSHVLLHVCVSFVTCDREVRVVLVFLVSLMEGVIGDDRCLYRRVL